MSARIKKLNEMMEIIVIAIAREDASIEFYSVALEKATTETAKIMFSLLVEQEKAHESRLRAQLHKISAEIEEEKLALKSKT